MSVAVGDKIRILAVDEDIFGIYEDNGFVVGAIGTVIEGDERLRSLAFAEDSLIVQFPETHEGEAFYFTDAEEGVIWERA